MSDDKNLNSNKEESVIENDSDKEKSLNIATLFIAAFCFIPIVFLFVSGLENRGALFTSLTLGGALVFGFLFCRVVSKVIQKYCEKNEIILAKKKLELMSRYDPGMMPTLIIKFSRIINMIAGAVSMWWLSNEFDYDYIAIAVVAGLILFTAIQGRDVTVDLDALEIEREENKKRREERRQSRDEHKNFDG